MNVLIYFALLIGAFAILAKSADVFVDSAVNIAESLKIPKIIIGIVLVGFATTAPEFAVSVQSAYLGHPEVALGNAVGSVICDDGIAMALAAIVATVPIVIHRRILKAAAAFLIIIYGISYGFALNGTIDRFEGAILVLLLAVYIYSLFRMAKKERSEAALFYPDVLQKASSENPPSLAKGVRRQFMVFILGLAGVIISSRIIIWSCLRIAEYLRIPEVVMGLTIVAIGTSLPEISTCIAAARKGQGEIAAGDIIGADILNILWIIGVSALVNPIHVSQRIVHFMFPWMFLIVGVMLISMRVKYRMGKPKGALLLTLYGVYLLTTIKFFY